MVHKVSWLHGNFQDPLENIQSIRKLSRLFGNFPRYPKINFRTIWKISILSGNFPGYSEIFQAIRKLSGPSGKYQEISQAIKKLSRPYRKYPDCPESFQIIQKISRPSTNFPDHPETFQTIGKLSRWSENFREHRGLRAKSFRTCKNFLVGNTDTMTRFFYLWKYVLDPYCVKCTQTITLKAFGRRENILCCFCVFS